MQTELTAGQSENPHFQALDSFADEVMALLGQNPTPDEILVEQVKPLRFAEASGRYPEMFEMLNSH